MLFYVVMFSFLPSSSFTVTTLIFRIPTLTIVRLGYTHALTSLFVLCPRPDDILNCIYLFNSIAEDVGYYIGIGVPATVR
jgi:hypothetical protein